MTSVSLDDLQGQLGDYFQQVRDGEEIVVRDGSKPIARILPFRLEPETEHEARLVAAGLMKMPQEETDWDDFFSIPGGDVSDEVAVRAVIEGRGDW